MINLQIANVFRAKVEFGASIEVQLDAIIQSPSLWHFDRPNLNAWQTTLFDSCAQSYQTKSAVLGIRAIEISGGQFILNGEPVRLVRMTRHADSPEFSSASQFHLWLQITMV